MSLPVETLEQMSVSANPKYRGYFVEVMHHLGKNYPEIEVISLTLVLGVLNRLKPRMAAVDFAEEFGLFMLGYFGTIPLDLRDGTTCWVLKTTCHEQLHLIIEGRLDYEFLGYVVEAVCLLSKGLLS